MKNHENTEWRLVREIGQLLTAEDVHEIAIADYGYKAEECEAYFYELLNGTLAEHDIPWAVQEVLTLSYYNCNSALAEKDDPQTYIRLLFCALGTIVAEYNFPIGVRPFGQAVCLCAERLRGEHAWPQLVGFFENKGQSEFEADGYGDLDYQFTAIVLAAIYGAPADALEKRCEALILDDAKRREHVARIHANAAWLRKIPAGLDFITDFLYHNEPYPGFEAESILVWWHFVRRLIPHSPETPLCNYVREQFEAAAAKARLTECEPGKTTDWFEIVANNERTHTADRHTRTEKENKK